MARVVWQFYDPQTAENYSFTVNPAEGGTPTRKKNITKIKTTAWNAKPLLFEGADEPLQFAWSGVLLTQEQLQAYITWFNKRTQVRLTDDLGRVFYLYIIKFAPKRERAAHHPWKFSYAAEAIALDWVVGATPSIAGFSRGGVTLTGTVPTLPTGL